MKLYEFEGHRLLAKVGIISPFFVVAENLDEVKQARKRLKFPVVAKIQVLTGKRAKGGGVQITRSDQQLLKFAKNHFGQQFLDEEVRFIALFEKVAIERELYLAIGYDTSLKSPYLMYSSLGGIDIEEVKKTNPAAIIKLEINPQTGPSTKDLRKNRIPEEFAQRTWDAFTRFDCRLLEINPLAQTPQGELVALDAKVILDDNGLSRHKDLDVLPKGTISAVPSEREILARQIDAADYRGSAGSTFIDLDGDIAILASGGGASLLVMDSVVAAGGKPANYTEYSGNPPREKVQKLTQITLSRPGLTGALVAGAVANFTDIYETLAGFVDGLRQIKPQPDYPIVIRRGGPCQKEAYEMLEKIAKKDGFDFHLFGPETPISVACKKMVELANQYKVKVKSVK